MVLDADEHDRMVALTSHLPQLASTALAATRGGEELTTRAGISGPGLDDMTRLALSAYELWRDILATNTEHVDRALAVLHSKAGAHARKPSDAAAFKRNSSTAPPWRAACGGDSFWAGHARPLCRIQDKLRMRCSD